MSKSRYAKETDPETGDMVDVAAPMPIAEETPQPAPATNGEVAESKSDKYLRLMGRRLPRAVKALDSIANLGNTAQYEASIDSREYVIRILTDAYHDTCMRLRGEKPAKRKLQIPR